jgi:dipeptidyl aminopeptidase/acylaminoacyl peptidase
MRLKVVLLVSLGCAAGAMLSAAARHTMLMNRLGPSAMTLYIANADGSGERPLFPTSGFDYNASFSPDGRWIVFTSERGASGQADLYRVHPDGSGLERLTDDPDLDDQGVISPDGRQLAFVSTRGAHTADVWTLDLSTHKVRNLTGGQALPRRPPISRAHSGPRGRPMVSGSHSRPTGITRSGRTSSRRPAGSICRS